MKKACSRMNLVGTHLQVKPMLREKLVLHRGWHKLGADCRRPVENTRQAYLDASKLGVAFAECDIWSTKDSELVLCHDPTFERVAQDPQCELARTKISELNWCDLQPLQLQDGSSPVRLTNVLEDLVSTQTRLVIEMSSTDPAAPLAALLRARGDLLPAVGWVMSFSINSLTEFVERGAPDEVRKAWLTSNPRTPYDASLMKEGETTFHYTRETLQTFLDRVGFTEMVKKTKCFLYVQYHHSVTTPHLAELREEIRRVLADPIAGDVALGLWSDIELDPHMDREDSFCEFIEAVDFINSDMPDSFWNSAHLGA